MPKTWFMQMRKRYWTISILSLLLILVLGYGIIEFALEGRHLQSYYSHYSPSNNLNWNGDWILPRSSNNSQVFPPYTRVSSLSKHKNFSAEELHSLLTWDHMNSTVASMENLPHAAEAVAEGQEAWRRLMDHVKMGRGHEEAKGQQCPFSLRKMNSSEFGEKEVRMSIPCGLVQGSSITLIGTPRGMLGEFRIDLRGASFPGEPDPPIVLHYNVRLHGDKVSKDPVIVQNTWTAAGGWGEEERCSSMDRRDGKKVDELEQCNEIVGKYSNRRIRNGENTGMNFPFSQGNLGVATLRIGMEGIQMTVDGKHITSFAYRDRLEPWLVNEVRISGDIELISLMANGLPTAEYSDNVVDLDELKSPRIQPRKPLDLFIGIFSTANNFRRRMAIRRTWLQYPAVKTGAVAAQFFVGLHKNQMVNEELWYEARTYGDIQLMPFVDYYSLITWKTIAICIYSTNMLSAKYVMKTDDDSFVRVDELLSSLKGRSLTRGVLYGLINFDDQPQRTNDSKWYVSSEEWPYDTYPPWAHGPGYIISRDIAKTVCKMQRKRKLWIFKLEDVAMGIWIAQTKKNGMEITYVNEERIYMEGCESGYMVAHYQGPRDMLCLWKKLKETSEPTCC